MIPKEWRDYTWKVRPLVVLVFVLVSPAMALILQLLWSLEGVDWPAWVQAIGSVLGILVAVHLADKGRRDLISLRAEEAIEREHAHAERLYQMIREVRQMLQQMTDQLSENPKLQVGGVTVAAFERVMNRAQLNLDDDLSVRRHKIASKFRINLTALIHQLHQAEDGTLDIGIDQSLSSAVRALDINLADAKLELQPFVRAD